MTLKGLPQPKRNARWHKRHVKKLAKDKARHKVGRGHALWSPDLAQAESHYKETKAQESNHRRGERHQRPLIKRLWSKLVSVWIRAIIRIKKYAGKTKKDKGK